MIKISVERNGSGYIARFTVKGHAEFDKPGKDIVCAGVSAVTVGTVNAIEKLTGSVPGVVERSGYLKAETPFGEDDARNAQVQLLLEGMLVSLETIAESYGKYVTIKETLSGKGG